MPRKKRAFELRPGVNSPLLWSPERPKRSEWDKIRRAVLARDDYTCIACGHRALKYMNVHHLDESEDNSIKNLATMCVACHAVMHIGRNLALETIELWKSSLSQVEIVRRTREGIRQGCTLAEINRTFRLRKLKRFTPHSVEWANELVLRCLKEDLYRCEYEEPICAVFVNFKQWQIEG